MVFVVLVGYNYTPCACTDRIAYIARGNSIDLHAGRATEFTYVYF